MKLSWDGFETKTKIQNSKVSKIFSSIFVLYSNLSHVAAFATTSMKSWLEKNDIEMYSQHNEGKSIVTERFIRTLKNKT